MCIRDRNKAELVAAVAEKTNFTKKDAEVAINALLASVEEALVKGEKVQLIGFGTFETRERKARQGRNPRKPDEIIKIAASKAVSYTHLFLQGCSGFSTPVDSRKQERCPSREQELPLQNWKRQEQTAAWSATDSL